MFHKDPVWGLSTPSLFVSPPLFPSPPAADVAAVNHVPIDRLWPTPPGPARSAQPRLRTRPTVRTRGHQSGALAARPPLAGLRRGLPRPLRPASALRWAWRRVEPLAVSRGAGGDTPSPTTDSQPRWSRRSPLPAGGWAGPRAAAGAGGLRQHRPRWMGAWLGGPGSAGQCRAVPGRETPPQEPRLFGREGHGR